MCIHQAHDDVHTTGTKIDFFASCAFCVPHVCRSSCDPCLIKIRKVWTISCRMSPIALKSDIPGALWLNLKFKKFFEKCRKLKNFRFFWKIFSNFKLSHRALGMSDFDARGLIRQEIVHIFRILIKHKSHNYLHTCGTQKAHHTKKSIFVHVLCILQYSQNSHISRNPQNLKIWHQGFPTPCPDLKSDKNSLL